MQSWIDYWNTDTPIYVNERHKQLHYQGIAQDLCSAMLPSDQTVLDFGCGEALSADIVAAHCTRLYLCDAAANVRTKLKSRFSAIPNMEVVSPQDVQSLPDENLDLVIANSVLQYIPQRDFELLLDGWHRALRPEGRVILADVIPPDLSALTDATALLKFGFSGGFLLASLTGLARTALSDYRKIRSALGLATYSEPKMLEILGNRGFSARRLPSNFGHNDARMCFVAIKNAVVPTKEI